MENLKILKKKKKDVLKKIQEGAPLCVRKKYLYIFESEEKLFNTSFSISSYNKTGKYPTLQMEISLEGKGITIASRQSKHGKENLKSLYNLIKIFKELTTTIKTLENIEDIEEEISSTKFHISKKTKSFSREN